jgi:hypothetical protein
VRTLLQSATVLLATATLVAIGPETLRSTSAIPAHIAGRFRDPIGFQQSASGQYFVLDRRGHTVYGIDERFDGAWEIVQIGSEAGRIIDPVAFGVEPGGTFVVADAPDGRERVQVFTPAGVRIGGFQLPVRAARRIVLGNLVLNGIGSLQYTGTSILLSMPETGALITEYTLGGRVVRTFGDLRSTGHEEDRDLHTALNSGLPLVDPRGGFFFVFQTGEPAFRKYDAEGRLAYERHIQGREIDEVVGRLPRVWPPRRAVDGEQPLVSPTIRTAAVDATGRLWVALVEPFTYQFDADGDKLRIVQLRAAGIVSPNSLSFDRKGRLLVTPGLYIF